MDHFEFGLRASVRGVRLGFIVGALAILCTSTLALAQASNSRRGITLIIPYAAGGLPDVMARVLQAPLEKQLGQRIIIENRVGGGGLVGSQVGMAAKPDGNTLIWETATSAILSQLTKKDPQFDLRKMVPITQIAYWPNRVTISTTVKADTVKDFVDLVKAAPGKYKVNVINVGSVGHLLAELFMIRTGTKMVIVPYSGATEASMSMATGETQMNVGIFDALAPPGIKTLCIVSKGRMKNLPDVPTCEEGGIPDYSLTNWAGVYAPPGTPEKIVTRLSNAVQAALKDPDVIKHFDELVLIPVVSDPVEFRKLWEGDWAAWQETIKESGFQPQ